MRPKVRGIAVSLFLIFLIVLPSVSSNRLNTATASGGKYVEIDVFRGIIFFIGHYHTVDWTNGVNITFAPNETAHFKGFVYCEVEGTLAFIGGPMDITSGLAGFNTTKFLGFCRGGHLCGMMIGTTTFYFIL